MYINCFFPPCLATNIKNRFKYTNKLSYTQKK